MLCSHTHTHTHGQRHPEPSMRCDILHPCLCLYVHTCTCAPLFLGCLPGGRVKQGAKGLRREGHSSNSKYVSTMHPSPSRRQLRHTHTTGVGCSVYRHVPVSLYSRIQLLASAFECSPTMLMRGYKGGLDRGDDGRR